MREIIGKWLLDVAKYIATALILSRAFVGQQDTFLYFAISLAIFAFILACGLLLLWYSRREKKKKYKKSDEKNNEDFDNQ